MDIRRARDMMFLLQLSGGCFPVGGFSQSLGVETLIQNKTITNKEDLTEVMEGYISRTLCENEVPLMIHVYNCVIDGDWVHAEELNRLAIASKLTHEMREACLKSGKSFLRIGKELIQDAGIDEFYNRNRDTGISYPAAYAVVTSRAGVDLGSSVAAYYFSSINTIVQCAVKLIPLGNTDGQIALKAGMDIAADCAVRSMEIPVDGINTFSPMIDISSMEHETIRPRLYMS